MHRDPMSSKVPKAVVISQSMYFPWIGLLEQIRIADLFIHYDDVQYVRGFFNRVQIKTASGSKWLSVPLRDQHRGQRIDEVLIDDRINWRTQHRNMLKNAYLKAPFREEMLGLVDQVFDNDYLTLADLSRSSMMSLVNYFNLSGSTQFANSLQMEVPGAGSQRLHDLCLAAGASVYVTGHGARNYLDHGLFVRSGIQVEYMKYRMTPYPQLHGGFTPYVTALDLIANCGKERIDVISSETIHWKEFSPESN
jgi:hypothetical protein